MELTELQKDALTELINIAFSRAAASLSDLTSKRVELQVPEVSVHPIGEVQTALGKFVSGEVATVHQVFSGKVSGDALLLLNVDGASHLAKLLTGEESTSKRMGASAQEVVSEVGNILLNACLGVFGNILYVRFSFTVPRLHLDSLSGLLQTFVIDSDELRQALVVGAQFHLQGTEVTGCLVVVLGVPSLALLLQALENWAETMASPQAAKEQK
jgi:chemotaxis protein CheC